jgi:hypothetical protein
MQPGKALKVLAGQLTESDTSFRLSCKLNAANVLAVLCEVQPHTVQLLLMMQNCADTAGCQHGCLVQPAVGPSSAEQAARVVSTAAQHFQQTGIWQLQQQGLRHSSHPA